MVTMRFHVKTDNGERLARVAGSADRLVRMNDMSEKGNPAPEIIVCNELRILWRRSLALWIRMRWPRLAAWWNGR